MRYFLPLLAIAASQSAAAPQPWAASQAQVPLTSTSPITSLAHRLSSSIFDFVGSFKLPSIAQVQSEFAEHFNLDANDVIEFDESKSIWDTISTSPHLTQLAHVLNYSSDATKKLLDGDDKKLTFFAPVNWHKEHRCDSSLDSYAVGACEASHQSWQQLERHIGIFEAARTSDKKKDQDRRRKFIAHLIDAVLRYHLVETDDPDVTYNAETIASYSSVPSWLSIPLAWTKDEKHATDVHLNDGQPWRIRVGKSLLPFPGVYLNFYSRVMSPNHSARNGLIHAISKPLLPPPSVLQSLFFGLNEFSDLTTALQKVHGDIIFGLPHHHRGNDSKVSADGDEHHHPHPTPHAALTLFAPSNHAWKKLPTAFRLFLFSPFGTRFLTAILMLHSLEQDIVFADFVHAINGSGSATDVRQTREKIKEGWGQANVTRYTFNSALPKLRKRSCDSASVALEELFLSQSLGMGGIAASNCAAEASDDEGPKEYEKVDVAVSRYFLLPGGRGPLQTRMSVQGVGVLFQDIPAANGVFHLLPQFIKPKGHPHAGLWADIAREASEAGFGHVDLVAEAAKPANLAW